MFLPVEVLSDHCYAYCLWNVTMVLLCWS